MNPNDVAPLVISVVLFVSTAAVFIFRGPIGKAIARRIEGNAGVDHALAARVSELEERLDFAERLLASGGKRTREIEP